MILNLRIPNVADPRGAVGSIQIEQFGNPTSRGIDLTHQQTVDVWHHIAEIQRIAGLGRR